MWHDIAGHVLARLAEGTPAVPSTDSTSNVVIALLGAAVPVLGAIGFVLNTLRDYRKAREDRQPLPNPIMPPIPLSSGTVDDAKDARLDALETFLMKLHYNPHQIKTGQENPDDIRFD